jgi:hypothetical protein
MKFLAIFLLLSTAALTGCSAGSGPGSILNPPPVQAATYSNASVVGTYAFNFTQVGFGATSTNILTSTGTFIADGNGNITSGAVTERAGGASCTESVTGTYTVQSDASGTVSATTAPSGTNGCAVTGSLHLVIQIAQQGQGLLLTQNDPNVIATGTALKQ